MLECPWNAEVKKFGPDSSVLEWRAESCWLTHRPPAGLSLSLCAWDFHTVNPENRRRADMAKTADIIDVPLLPLRTKSIIHCISLSLPLCVSFSLLYFFCTTHKLRQIVQPRSELWGISRFPDDLLSAFVFSRVSDGQHKDWTVCDHAQTQTLNHLQQCDSFGFKHMYTERLPALQKMSLASHLVKTTEHSNPLRKKVRYGWKPQKKLVSDPVFPVCEN